MPAEYYNQIFASRPWGCYPDMELIKAVSGVHPEDTADGLSAMEIGCGPGANLGFLADKGFSIVALDCSAVALDLAAKRMAAHPRGRNVWMYGKKDFRELPVEEFGRVLWHGTNRDKLDLIVDVCALQETVADLEEGRAAFEKARCLLAKGGLLFSKFLAIGGDIPALSLCRFLPTYPQVKDMFQNFASVQIESVSETRKSGTALYRHWVISARA